MKKNLKIAIDGPVAAGKGTISAILAKKLNLLYVYTGAMYRALALLAKRKKIDLKDEEQLLKLFKKSKISFKKPSPKNLFGYAIFLDGEDITQKIRTPESGWGASVVGLNPRVRKLMVKKQQEIARNKGVVMEGRDITTKVLPEADLKIFLTASLKTRARRRQKQFLKEFRIKKNFLKIYKETRLRDEQDSLRKTDPLKIVKDAWVLDTTKLTIDQVVEKTLKKLKKLKLS